MKITVSELNNERRCRAAIGMNLTQFQQLLVRFKQSYVELHRCELSQRKVDTALDYCIHNEEELLLFTLFSLKSGLTFDLLGLVCGMNASNALRNQKIGIQVLTHTLHSAAYMPKRKFLSGEDFKAYFRHELELFLDATEQRIQRHQDNEQQRSTYSGKKKPTL